MPARPGAPGRSSVNALSGTEALDRHALVMAEWLAAGSVAAVLFHHGLGRGGALSILLAFAAVLAGFAGHIVINAVYRTTFTRRELALGLVTYAAGLLAFGAGVLVSPGVGRHFVLISLGFLAVFAAVLFYMITYFGVRGAFEGFDVIRDFTATGRGDTKARRGERG